jgi:hypothetical protein
MNTHARTHKMVQVSTYGSYLQKTRKMKLALEVSPAFCIQVSDVVPSQVNQNVALVWPLSFRF